MARDAGELEPAVPLAILADWGDGPCLVIAAPLWDGLELEP